MTVSNALVLAEEESDLTTANADITSWHVGVFTKVTVELGHEGLAESHDLSLGRVMGIKVRPTLRATDRHASQSIFFEDLLKTKELNRS